MAIPESYVNNVGNLAKFLDAVRTAGIPERVTFEFLKSLGFKSSNDRPIISVLKGIGFLDQNGAPTTMYREFRDPHRGPKVLGKALKNAYSELFLANTKAHTLSVDKIKGIVATKTNKSDTVVRLIAATFKALSAAADFSKESSSIEEPSVPDDETEAANSVPAPTLPVVQHAANHNQPEFHYNIQIHLPTTTDITVYNAIFKSLREHLL